MEENGRKWFIMALFEKCVYVGEYQHGLDDKGRLTIPSKWRFVGDQEEVYLALPNPIGCVTVYPPKMVARLEEKVSGVSLGNQAGQKALMQLFSKADTLGCDKQGRIILSEKLRSFASLQKEVNLVGNFTLFHIWNPLAYTNYMKTEGQDLEQTSQILSQLGL